VTVDGGDFGESGWDIKSRRRAGRGGGGVLF
jgi:hypothetical protein